MLQPSQDIKLTQSLVDHKFNRTASIASILVAAILGVGLVYYATHLGIGVGWDSMEYLRGAREIQEQSTYSSIHFPPITSLLLALTDLVAPDFLIGVRWLYILLFALSIALFGILVYVKMPSTGFVFIGSALFAIWLSGSFAVLLSEPPFFVFTLASFLSLVWYFKTKSITLLIVSALAASLAMATRYSGIVVIAANFVVLLIYLWPKWRSELHHIAIYIAATTLVIAPWLLWNRYHSGQLTSRQIEYYPVSVAEIGGMADNILEWMLPEVLTTMLPLTMRIAAVLVVYGVLVLLYFKLRYRLTERDLPYGPTEMFGVFAPLYTIFLVISRLFLDPDIDLGYRQLSPVFMAFIYFCLSIIYDSELWEKQWNRIGIRLALLLVSLIFIVMYLRPVLSSVRTAHHEGIAYTSLKWRNSEMMQYLQTTAPDTVIYTNAPLLVEYYVGRESYALPSPTTSVNKTAWSNENYLEEVVEMELILDEHGVVIAYFDDYPENQHGVNTLAKYIALPEPTIFADGTLYMLSKDK